MTAQIDDYFLYEDEAHRIAGMSGEALFDISTLDLHPVPVSTACWRGYVVEYGLVDRHLAVVNLYVNLREEGERYRRRQGPTIQGVVPTDSGDEYRGFDNHYASLNLPLTYSGGLLLATGFIEKLYVHMGFQSAWKYRHVRELVGDYDRSEKMAQIRDTLTMGGRLDGDSALPADQDIYTFVEKAFDRKYRIDFL